jgi:dGTPase
LINKLYIRQRIQAREETLSPYAAKSWYSRGRLRQEEPSPVRTAFQRDRDRIIHCNAFRRLKHKTQVYISPLGDHYVTRLTHTLEVSQIARTISRALMLNEDLTEAISLGHDLGHTPFGHLGEEALDSLYPGGFRHNEQSLRVVDYLEKDGKGLNLTWEVRDGILNHSKPRHNILDPKRSKADTLEGEVCQIADSVAYINHDITDSIRAGVISESDLPDSAIRVLGKRHSERINNMVGDIISDSWGASGRRSSGSPGIGMSPPVLEASNTLREFLFERVYNLHSAQTEAEKARGIVRCLYRYFNQEEARLPVGYRRYTDDRERRVVDYIAGMTDQFASRLAEELALARKSK